MRIFGAILILVLSSSQLFAQTTHDIWMQSRMSGNIYLDDGSSTEFWGYGLYTPPTPGPQVYLPGPLLRFNEGDTVNVHFFNNSPEDHTIHWHGLDVDQANDGVPTTSSAVDPDSLRIYSFVCTNAGTYNYHCHVLTTLHLAMGMYGLFVVDPDPSQTRIYTNGPRYTKDYNWLASELNKNWGDNPISPGLFTLYEATNVLLNGKEGSQLTGGAYSITGTTDDTIAVRLGNMGYGSVRYIFPSEANMTIHMSDGRALPGSIDSDTIEVYPGERYTVILDPNVDFTDSVTIEYTDLRTNLSNGTNYVPIIIQGAGIEEIESLSDFSVIENPVGNILAIDVQSDELDLLHLYSLSGQQLDVLHVNKGINLIPLYLAEGVYILSNPESGKSVRFVKQ